MAPPDPPSPIIIDIVGTDNDSDIAYYFTGDLNLTGLKVDNNGTSETPSIDSNVNRL